MTVKYDILDEMIKRDAKATYPAQDVLPGFLGTFNPDVYTFRFNFSIEPVTVKGNPWFTDGIPESVINAIAERIEYLFSSRRIVRKYSLVHIYTNRLNYKDRGYDTEDVLSIPTPEKHNKIYEEIGITFRKCSCNHMLKILNDIDAATRIYAESTKLLWSSIQIFKQNVRLANFPIVYPFSRQLHWAAKGMYDIEKTGNTSYDLRKILNIFRQLFSKSCYPNFRRKDFKKMLLDIYEMEMRNECQSLSGDSEIKQ